MIKEKEFPRGRELLRALNKLSCRLSSHKQWTTEELRLAAYCLGFTMRFLELPREDK